MHQGFTTITAFLVSFWLLVLQPAIAENLPDDAYGSPEIIGQQDNESLSELSGLAQSPTQPDFFWAVNDGGNGPILYLLNKSGEYKDEVELSTLGNHDWEDVETFTYRGTSYIAIADIGDNYTRRKVYYVHLVPEPKLTRDGTIGSPVNNGIRTIAFQYEDGPRDAESLGIDLARQRILVLTKRDAPPRMYSLPLVMNPKRFVYRASHLTDMPQLGGMSFNRGAISFNKGSLTQSIYAGQPTSMTVYNRSPVIPLNTSLAILSYGSVWLMELLNTDPVTIQQQHIIQLPAMPQAEALAVDADGSLMVMSESLGSAIVRIPKS